MIFRDRREAGRDLARALREAGESDGIVLGLPRGGVPVAFEVARELSLPLDIFVVRKLGVPGEPELAMGAVSSGGLIYINEVVVRAFRIRPADIDAVVARESSEVERRDLAYRAGRTALPLADQTVIVVDDGLATGSTMMAAVRALRSRARRIVVAVPVAPPATCEELRREAVTVVCLSTPELFHAVGEFYREFNATSDAEVTLLLGQARGRYPSRA